MSKFSYRNKPLGLYLHIPFCVQKCGYCDFYSVPDKELMKDYVSALLTHIRSYGALCSGYTVDTVYIGGGTPTCLGPKYLGRILQEVRNKFPLADDAEITVECNPESTDKKMLEMMKKQGVNRLSFGVQSAHDDELKAIGRLHTFQQAKDAVDLAREKGFSNISLDLMYGLPGQSLTAWETTLEHVLELAPEHMSCYGLKVEPGTPLDDRVVRGEKLPDDDQQADMYLWTVERLAAAGYRQYEISNFARAGFQSRHNLKYWLTRPYLGFGPGAHSDFGGRRFSFVRDLDAYIDGVLNGGPIIDEDDLIPKRERSGEYLMLRLRTTWGIEEWEYRREYFMNFDPIEQKLAEYEHRGWAARDGQRWRLTPQGFLVSNQLIGELLELQESATLETTLPRVRREREQEI